MKEQSCNWRRALSSEQRAALVEWHQITIWTTAKLVILVGIWLSFGLCALYFESFWVHIICWLIIGFTLHGIAIFMHEGAHRSLFKNVWPNRLVGFLCGLPVFFSCSSYRATHLLHHRFENSSRDPDNLEVVIPNQYIRAAVYYGWLLGGTAIYVCLVTVLGPRRARGREEKLACVIEPTLITGFYIVFFWLAWRFDFTSLLGRCWGWALPFALLIANIRGLAEHTQLSHGEPADPMRATRSIISNRLISFFFNNQNYHLEHHLFPAMPWNKLPHVHQLLRPVYQQRQASVVSGYFEWFRCVWYFGPLRYVEYRNRRGYAAHEINSSLQTSQ